MNLNDLYDRLERAEAALVQHAKGATSTERARLEGKANGVNLARSYVEEMLRARADLWSEPTTSSGAFLGLKKRDPLEGARKADT